MVWEKDVWKQKILFNFVGNCLKATSPTVILTGGNIFDYFGVTL